MRPAVQFFTLRDVGAALPELLELVAETPVEGVEFAGIGDAEPATVAWALDAADLDAAGAHVDARTVEDEFEAVVGTYRTPVAPNAAEPRPDPAGGSIGTSSCPSPTSRSPTERTRRARTNAAAVVTAV